MLLRLKGAMHTINVHVHISQYTNRKYYIWMGTNLGTCFQCTAENVTGEDLVDPLKTGPERLLARPPCLCCPKTPCPPYYYCSTALLYNCEYSTYCFWLNWKQTDETASLRIWCVVRVVTVPTMSLITSFTVQAGASFLASDGMLPLPYC